MLGAIFAAADAQVRAAGGVLTGGHTIRDAEPKYGLAVIGTVIPTGIWPKNGASPGDALFVTKPLGTGLIMTGYKRGLAGSQQLERAVRWMRTLNGDAADVLRGLEPNAVTDVTGFGLFGHCHEVADRSGVPDPARGGALPGDRRRARHGAEGVRTRRPAQPRLRGAARRRPGSPTRSTRSASIRRPPAACSSRSPPTGPRRSRPSSRRSKLYVRRIGRVEEGSGVVVRSARAVSRRGMIHGRFQPFHLGHLEYLRGAAARSDEVFIGITNPDPTRMKPEASDPLRHLPESNPWTYTERLLMVKAAAGDLGLTPGGYT